MLTPLPALLAALTQVPMSTPLEPTIGFGAVRGAERLGAGDEVLYVADVPGGGRLSLRVPLTGGVSSATSLALGGESSPDGRHHAQVVDDTLRLVDLVSEASWPLQQPFLGSSGATFRFSPDGARIAFLGVPGSQLGSAPSDGSAPPVFVNLFVEGAVSYAFSADSSRLVFRTTNGRLYAVGAAGGTAVRLDAAGTVEDFALTPDASRAVFSAEVAPGRLGLFVVPLDGSVAPLLLSGAPFPGGGGVLPPFLFSADGQRVVFRGDLGLALAEQLYSVRLDASALPVALSGPPLLHRRIVPDCALDPSGTRVLFRGDLEAHLRFELYSAPVDGSSAHLRLNGELVAGGSVRSFRLGRGGTRLAYLADQSVDERFELYSVRCDGTGASVLLSGDPVAWADVEDDYAVAPSGLAVAFRSDRTTDGEARLWLRALGGGGVLRELTDTLAAGVDVPTGFFFTPDSSRLVYRANDRDPRYLELFSTDFGVAQVLNVPLEPGLRAGDIVQFRLAQDGQRVLYRADRERDEVFELFSEGFGARPLVKLSPELAADDDVLDFALTPDGRAVVYRTGFELYAQAVDGSGARVVLSSGSSTFGFRIAEDGARVVYRHGDALRAAHLSGAPAPLVLHSVVNRSVGALVLAPGTGRVVFELTAGASVPRQLWSVPVDGSAPSVPLTPFVPGRIQSFLVSADGREVVYVADQDTLGVLGLYRAPVDAGTPAVRLDLPPVAGGDVSFTPTEGVLALGGESAFVALAPDGSRVAYVADAEVDDVAELFAVPLDGSSAPQRLASMGPVSDVRSLRITPDSARVVYRADADVDESVELYSVPLDGRAPSVKLNPAGVTLPAGGPAFLTFACSASTGRVVFLGQAGFLQGLYSVPWDGSGPAVKVSGALDSDLVWDLELELSPDGRALLFERRSNPTEYYLATVDGSAPPERVGAPIGRLDWFPGAAPFHAFTLDSQRVVFLADLAAGGVRELFASFRARPLRRAR